MNPLMTCATRPILFPVNATGGGGQKELDILSFSNVKNPTRYFAHVFVAWIFLGNLDALCNSGTLEANGVQVLFCT